MFNRPLKTTQLTVEVEYNPQFTDPEGLACALDRLLETALSTPGIMEDYGEPTVREFFVAEASDDHRLRIDGPLLRDQRRLLLTLLDRTGEQVLKMPISQDERALLEGISELLAEIADQAHDRHGIDCLESTDEDADS
jgi:hypothetical protein